MSTKADDLASKAKVKADKAKADELSKKYQEYIQSKKEPVQHGPQTPNDLYDTNYISNKEWEKGIKTKPEPVINYDDMKIITPKQSKAILKEQKLRNFI